jgi:hypothetical protein
VNLLWTKLGEGEIFDGSSQNFGFYILHAFSEFSQALPGSDLENNVHNSHLKFDLVFINTKSNFK